MTNSFLWGNSDAVPNVYSPANCPAITSPGCPQHTSSSGADVITDSLTDFLRQAITLNTFELQYEFNSRYSGYIGYRFDRRNITDINCDNQVSVFFPTLPNGDRARGSRSLTGLHGRDCARSRERLRPDQWPLGNTRSHRAANG